MGDSLLLHTHGNNMVNMCVYINIEIPHFSWDQLQLVNSRKPSISFPIQGM